MRTIKKYPNRRLYDTENSAYITVSDVRDMVLKGVEFEVVTANTNEDITRSILLQIIMDQESDGEHLFTSDMLSKFIRFYQDDTRDLFSRYMDRTLSVFLEQQHVLQKKFMDAIASNPIDSMKDLTTQNVELWKEMQKNFLDSVGFGKTKKTDSK